MKPWGAKRKRLNLVDTIKLSGLGRIHTITVEEDSFFLHFHTFLCHPILNVKNIVLSFFVPPPYII